MIHTILPGKTPSDYRISIYNATEEWAGEIEHLLSEEVYKFKRFFEMLFLIHELMERMGHPQTTAAMRSWSVAKSESSRIRSDYNVKKTATGPRQKAGGAPTFFVRIHFRQNATWQGSIQWLEGSGSRQFRSMLEMIMLMKEAVEISGGSEIDLSSWDDDEVDRAL